MLEAFQQNGLNFKLKKRFRNRELEFKIEFVIADNRSLIIDANANTKWQLCKETIRKNIWWKITREWWRKCFCFTKIVIP